MDPFLLPPDLLFYGVLAGVAVALLWAMDVASKCPGPCEFCHPEEPEDPEEPCPICGPGVPGGPRLVCGHRRKKGNRK